MGAASLSTLLGVVAGLEVAKGQLVLVEMSKVVLVAVAQVIHLASVLRHGLDGVVREARHHLLELEVLLVVLVHQVVHALVGLERELLLALDLELVVGVLVLGELLSELDAVVVLVEELLIEGLLGIVILGFL